MKPLYLRPLTDDERRALQAGVKSRSGFTVRRSQMLLLSAEQHLKPREIGQRLGCSDQAVRVAIHAFERDGLTCLEEKSHRPLQTERAFDATGEQQLRQVLHQSPRQYGYETSLWTLELLADLSYRQGWTRERVHLDTISQTLHRLGIRWQWAKQRISSPDPRYRVKKSGATG
jgi:transposase